MPITLAIVEDLDEVREGLKNFLALSPDFKVLDTYKTGEEACCRYSQAEAGYCNYGYQSPRHEWN